MPDAILKVMPASQGDTGCETGGPFAGRGSHQHDAGRRDQIAVLNFRTAEDRRISVRAVVARDQRRRVRGRVGFFMSMHCAPHVADGTQEQEQHGCQGQKSLHGVIDYFLPAMFRAPLGPLLIHVNTDGYDHKG